MEFIFCTQVNFLSYVISHKYDHSKEKYYKKIPRKLNEPPTWMSPIPWKKRLILLYTHFTNLSLLGPFTRCQYYWDFPASGKINMYTIPGFRVRSPISWSITAHYSPAGSTRGAGLLRLAVGILMVATWFVMRSCPWRRRAWVSYLCTCVTVGFYFAFWCDAEGIGSVSSGTMQGSHWCGRIGGSRVRFWIIHLQICVGFFCSCGPAFGGGISCGVVVMLKIPASCFRASVCLFPRVVSGISGIGLRRACVRS